MHLTVPDLRAKLEELYEKYMKSPVITLTPIKVDTKLEDLAIQLADAPASAARCAPDASRPKARSSCQPLVRCRPKV